MYCTSQEFLNKMRNYIDQIEAGSNGILRFEEYIPLPHFGHTILRFNISKETYTIPDLDNYEAFMQSIVKDEFLVDFMGTVYQKVGFAPWMYEDTFRKCYHKYNAVPIIEGNHKALLTQDTFSLLNQCGFSTEAKVWEIQPEEDISFFLLGDKNRKIDTYPFRDHTVHLYEVEQIPCIGLMKAIMYAKSQHISLIHALLAET